MDQKAVRRELLRHLRKDIIGPGWKHDGKIDSEEILETTGLPDNYYLCGFLKPIKDSEGNSMNSTDSLPVLDAEDSPDEGGGAENENSSAPSSTSTFLQPSSMGLTVCPDSRNGVVTEIILDISWGRYEKMQEGRWKRNHYQSDSIKILPEEIDYGENRDPISLLGQLGLHIRRGSSNHPTLTFRIVNELEVEKGSESEYTIFQPEIKLRSSTGWKDVRKSDPLREDKIMSILYSESRILALGHNVGVDWDDEGEIRTDFMPQYEMMTMREVKKLRALVPEMEDLCSEEDSSFLGAMECLDNLLNEYSAWIEKSKEDIRKRFDSGLIPDRLRDSSRLMNERAENNLARMRSGVDFLRNEPDARMAFVLANRSIRMSQNEPQHPDISMRSDPFKWRPFQIAFQLLNIESLFALEPGDSGWEDRGVVDLAWFPTAGGKTEAYLGLISALGFYRRIRFPEQEKTRPSVHTIMRYTLRLLVSDQADRLVRLVGAMNQVSKDHGMEGFHDFRLGMWVGGDVTPNRLIKMENDEKTAENSLQRLKLNLPEKKGAVIQFDVCPWCGDDSDSGIRNAKCWSIGELNGHKCLKGHCANSDCLFSEDNGGIPFSCVDDDLYLNPPSILLGTADKYAVLSRNPHARSIDPNPLSSTARKYNVRSMLAFGDSKSRPPDLIIQDELHLLTGPLGTLAGIVETAIDSVWETSGHKPKYVAATATIRGAESDVQLMYGRELNIFPPPVSKATDNFFAELDETPDEGRIHAALLGSPGKARTMTQLPLASLFQRLHELREDNPDIDDSNFDPYYTIVAYFNSKRELGGTQTMIRSRVIEELMPRLAVNDKNVRDLDDSRELTANRSSAELREAKAALNRRLGIDSNIVDYVLTTNMFQVGIDIPRLGAMAIVGQPKSNSEYIQSSGRVGRDTPGLVLSLLRSTFPRDQSHFETFRQFHQEAYKHVDVTSTTPFSQRSLDRAIGASLAIMLRMSFEELSGRFDLGKIALGGELREKASDLRDAFTKKLETREKHEIVQTVEPEVIEEAIRTVGRAWDNLISFSTNCINQDLKPAWELWNPREVSDGRRGWLDNDMIQGESGYRALSSLRDISPEVRLAEDRQVEEHLKDPTITYYYGDKMPEGHLFAQAAPGSIWSKDGASHLTMGVNRWHNGTSLQVGPQALQRVNDNPPGQWLELDDTRTMLPAGLRLRYLPKMEYHGAVTKKRFPDKYGYRCRDGHLSKYALYPDDEGNFICNREKPDGSECGRKAAPTRFVSICSNGHLSNFDYFHWCHDSKAKREGCSYDAELDLEYGRDSGETLKDWVVKCTKCGVKKSMNHALRVKQENGRPCQGHRPWLGFDANEDCEEGMVNVQVGATNLSFLSGGSILLIPLQVSWSLGSNPDIRALSKQTRKGRQKWDSYVEGDEDDLRKILAGQPYFKEDGDIDWNSLFEACETYRKFHLDNEELTVSNVRHRESQGFIDARHDRRYDKDKFECRPVINPPLIGSWAEDDWPVIQVSRADRISELRYITGVSRLDPEATPQPIDLPFDLGGEHYGIARDHSGEGIYFGLKPEWVCSIAEKRANSLHPEHYNMKSSMEWIRTGVRDQLPTVSESQMGANHLTIVHTFSHLLIRELCEVSGYSLGSIRERLYLHHDESGNLKRAGVFLYTSGPSSEGTLGGLARQGTDDSVQHIIERALSAINDCSNDPVCMDHKPTGNERNGAACHACLYLPETSCELGNLFLDRRWK